MSIPREADATPVHQLVPLGAGRHATPTLLAALVTFASATARAEPPGAPRDAAAAQALFYEARGLMRDGRYAEACPKLEQSLRMDAGTGTTFNLADCDEHLGRIASAWTRFLEAADAATAAGHAPRERVARDRAAKLEHRLPKLVVEVAAPPPGLAIMRDGIPLGAADFGTPLPVDPGSHRVVARAPGYEDEETVVVAREGQTSRVAVGALARVVTASPTTNRPPGAGTATRALATEAGPARGAVTTTMTRADTPLSAAAYAEPVVSEREASARGITGVVGWVSLGLGTAALVGSGTFGLRAMSRRDEARSHCAGDLCDARGVDLRAGAIRSGDASTAFAIGGGAAVLGGLLVLVLRPRARDVRAYGRRALEATRALQASASPLPGGGAIVLGGPLP